MIFSLAPFENRRDKTIPQKVGNDQLIAGIRVEKVDIVYAWCTIIHTFQEMRTYYTSVDIRVSIFH